jgi:hypothetical protein
MKKKVTMSIFERKAFMKDAEAGKVPTKPKRYCITSDDSGHEYFIEVGMEGEFENWLKTFEDPDFEYDGYDYEENRIDGRFTFTDPRCD